MARTAEKITSPSLAKLLDSAKDIDKDIEKNQKALEQAAEMGLDSDSPIVEMLNKAQPRAIEARNAIVSTVVRKIAIRLVEKCNDVDSADILLKLAVSADVLDK